VPIGIGFWNKTESALKGASQFYNSPRVKRVGPEQVKLARMRTERQLSAMPRPFCSADAPGSHACMIAMRSFHHTLRHLAIRCDNSMARDCNQKV
jgi:hypothetical protein